MTSSDRPLIPAARPIIGDEEVTAVASVLASGMLAQGSEVAAFEAEFSKELVSGTPCVALNSGTSGLHLGLLAAGIGPGDEVIVPSFTFAATANAVALTGATPIFADIEPDYYCLDPAKLERHISGRTRGIIPVHLYGHPADMAAIKLVAARHGLAIFEDAAQAHGAEWCGVRVGTFGTFGMFSLYPTKNMTSGEGGMVATRDHGLARRLRILRNQGMERQYANEIVGFNNRMTDVHAAIGRVQLRKLGKWTAQRQANAKFLDAHLENVVTPKVAASATHVYHQYTIRVTDDRDGFIRALREEYAVGSGAYYPTPVHRLASFGIDADLPRTERAASEVVSLPVHPSLSQADLDRIITGVNALAKAGA